VLTDTVSATGRSNPEREYVFNAMVGMARRAVPARVVAGGTHTRVALASEGVAPLHAARTSQRDVPTTLDRYGCLAGHAPGETAYANHRALVKTARDEFIGVACLDLEGYLSACCLDDAGRAGDRCAQRCGSKMSQFNFQSHRALIRIEERVERFPRSAFDQADEPRRAEDGWHALGSEVNDVLRAYDEAVFAKGASRWAGFPSRLAKPPALPEDSPSRTVPGMVRYGEW